MVNISAKFCQLWVYSTNFANTGITDFHSCAWIPDLEPRYTAVAPPAPEEPARVEVRASQPDAGQAHPRRVAVRVVKAAGAELGLFFTERGGHLEVTRYTGALADAIAEREEYNAGSKVVAGDRLYEVNDVGGNPAVLRDALAASRTASSLVLVFERNSHPFQCN